MNRKKEQFALGALLLAFIGLIALFLYAKAVYDPNIPFLPHNSKAQWIKFPSPLRTTTYRSNFCLFSKEFQFTSGQTVLLKMRAFKKWALFLNGAEVRASDPAGDWKKITTNDITSYLKEGQNNITVRVDNITGPPLLWLYTKGISPEIKTDETWIASIDNSPYSMAAIADDTAMPDTSFQQPLPSPWESFAGKYPALISFFLISVLIFMLVNFLKIKWTKPVLSPHAVLIIALIFWCVLFFNNLYKTLVYNGFDAKSHLSYVGYLLERHSLPLAADGWETYQPPLFYLITAVFFLLARHLVSGLTHEFLLSFKLVTFAGAMGQIYLAFIAARMLFPEDDKKQMLVTAMASILPFNIYIANFISNESLSAFLIGSCIVYVLGILKKDLKVSSFWFLGILLGLAFLTKVTVLVFLPVFCLVILYHALKKQTGIIKMCRIYLAIFLPMIAISGWFYFRNWLHYGKLIVTNMNKSLGFLWWQDPGYHTLQYYTSFGMSFERPFFSSFHSFLDGIYSSLWGDSMFGGSVAYLPGPQCTPPPPWNYGYMNLIFILAVPATVAILIGLWRLLEGAIKEMNAGFLLLVCSFTAMGASIIYLSLKVPSFAIVKAHYGLGLLVPVSVACAIGIDFIDEQLKKRKLPGARAILFGWLGTFAITIFFSFLIR